MVAMRWIRTNNRIIIRISLGEQIRCLIVLVHVGISLDRFFFDWTVF
jgi:hypothetical protein